MEEHIAVAPQIFKILVANDTGGQNVNTAQPWFPTAGAVTLKANTTYLFGGLLHTFRAAGAVSHTTSVLFGGTVTLTDIKYLAKCKTGDTSLSDGALNATLIAVQSATVIKAASTSTTEDTVIEVLGSLRCTTAGTLIPQFQYSAAPGGAPTIAKNSYFWLNPLGSNTVAIRGTWS